jgi:hypothetical protein
VTRIAGVHGIGNYHYVADTGSVDDAIGEISRDWAKALDIGLAGTGARPDLRVSYYAHLLHRGTPQGDTDPAFLDEDAQDLLIAWVGELVPATVSSIAQGPRTARARAAADWLSGHLGPQACRAALVFCREVSTYLSSLARRQAVRDAVAETIAGHRPSIVVAHSLGSVVAYETLWQNRQLEVDLLCTLGSPLGLPGAIFDRLDPGPVDGRGKRPPGVAAWANLADVGDIVAIPRTGLASCFEGLYYDNPAIIIDERAFHAVRHYLASPSTAEVLAPYLIVSG